MATAAGIEEDCSVNNYGTLPLVQSKEKNDRHLVPVGDITDTLVKQIIWVRGRLHTSRGKGKQCFLVIRHQFSTIQAILAVNENVSKQMVKFVSSIPKESIIDVEGEVSLAPSPINSCSQKTVELQLKKACISLFVVSTAEKRLPFYEDAMRPEDSKESMPHMTQETRLDNRVIDLRTPSSQAIYRIEASICKLFRDILDAKDFVEIHTPKIIS
ncbi:unnamed protein product, partial [Didymodactylos carnosus]